MVQSLAHQHHVGARTQKFSHLFHAFGFQPRFQPVLEIFFSQQIETIASHAAQHGVHHARRKLPVHRIQKRTQHRHQEDQPAPAHSPAERLVVPCKKRQRRDHGKVEQAAFHPPVNAGRAAGIVFWLFQSLSFVVPLFVLLQVPGRRVDEPPIVNNAIQFEALSVRIVCNQEPALVGLAPASGQSSVEW